MAAEQIYSTENECKMILIFVKNISVACNIGMENGLYARLPPRIAERAISLDDFITEYILVFLVHRRCACIYLTAL